MNSRSKFFLKFFSSPTSVGSITPSSKYLTKQIGNLVNTLPVCEIVEVGAGTGVITEAILNKNPKLIEIDSELCLLLKKKYPNLAILNNCCIDELRKMTGQFGLIVSIPLINNPIKPFFIEQLKILYQQGLLKWCVIYTYGFSSPLKRVSFKTSKRYSTVFRNIPPANIWVYK
jgi:phosphatidylethanolamine/phosphatidyl-N-methylethanolamine N-methyltransferase